MWSYDQGVGGPVPWSVKYVPIYRLLRPVAGGPVGKLFLQACVPVPEQSSDQA